MAEHLAGIVLVQNLFIKSERKASMSAIKQLTLRQGHGIEKDINANGFSPRQILVVNAQDLASLSIKPGELRENLVISNASSAKLTPGARISFPSGATVRLTFYCEPCPRIAYLVDSLKDIEQKRGVLGVVVKGGAIATNDTVKIEPSFFPALSEIPYERFLSLIKRIPPGKVISYRQILQSIGVDRSYFRVLPTYIKKTSAGYPVHRILNSQGQILAFLQQKKQLEAEEIKVTNANVSENSANNNWSGSVSLKDFAWQSPSIC